MGLPIVVCTVLHCTVFYCTVVYYTVLYFNVLYWSVETMELVIIDTVEPVDHALPDQKEEAWIYQLKSLGSMGYGGVNSRDEMQRSMKDRARLSCCCTTCKSVEVLKC